MTQSQGQKGLFAAAPYMSNEARYPRGYTPGRMAEVRDALMRMEPNGQKVPGSDHEYLSPQSAVKAPKMSDGLMEGSRKSVAGRHIRGVHEAIARSTVPAQALRTARTIETDPERLDKYNAHGLFEANTKRVTIGTMTSGDARGRQNLQRVLKRYPNAAQGSKDRQKVNDEEQRTQAETLIHELGHVRSYNDGYRNMERRSYQKAWTAGGSLVSGPEEAYADDHAVVHHRQDPREKARNGPQEVHTYLSGGNLSHQDRSYVDNRRHLQHGEVDLALDNHALSAKNAARNEARTKAARAEGDTPEFPGMSREVVMANPHLRRWQPSERPVGLQSNHLNGRQFGGVQ